MHELVCLFTRRVRTSHTPQAKELSQQIAVKAALKKKASGKEMTALLKRLELKGQPVWGLSVSERDLVKEARRLFNSC